ncbi:MAG: Bax inhibitor-1/YccA family protein [Eubacterium sp.]|nr:Bax inhibitor-1/YccA family protein [Eubacterium sp.]
MQLKNNPDNTPNNNSNYNNPNSYYESGDSSGTFDNTSYGDPGYYGDQSAYSQNPYNQYGTEQSVNPYQQYGYGRTDLGDGFYDEPAGSASVDMMNPLMKTAGMAAGVGGMMDSISNAGGSTGFGSDDSSYSRSHHNSYHHRHHYHRGYGYGTRNGAAGVVSAALINEVLVNAYLYMFIALLITGITALIVASSPAFFTAIFAGGRLSLIIILVLEFGLVIACTTAMQKDNFWLSAFLFAGFAIVNGLTFSVIFLVFTISSICRVFFITSLVFGIMSMYGAITKKDLTGWGPILFAGLIGIIVGSLINFFVGSTMADYVITIIGIVVFMAYTAYDVNKITKMSRMNTGLSAGVLGMYGAMELYLDFINLFIRLLRLMGKRK